MSSLSKSSSKKDLAKELRRANRELELLRHSAAPTHTSFQGMPPHAFYHDASRFGMFGAGLPAVLPTYSRDATRAASSFHDPVARKRDITCASVEKHNHKAAKKAKREPMQAARAPAAAPAGVGLMAPIAAQVGDAAPIAPVVPPLAPAILPLAPVPAGPPVGIPPLAPVIVPIVPRALEVVPPAQPNCWPPVHDVRPPIHASYNWEGPPQWPVGVSVNALTQGMRLALGAFSFEPRLDPDPAVADRPAMIIAQDLAVDTLYTLCEGALPTFPRPASVLARARALYAWSNMCLNHPLIVVAVEPVLPAPAPVPIVGESDSASDDGEDEEDDGLEDSDADGPIEHDSDGDDVDPARCVPGCGQSRQLCPT